MKEIRHILARYAARTPDERLALATVVRVEGSAYRRVGARMLVSSRGDWTGGISGGCLEGDALRRAQAAIGQTTPSVVTYDTREDDAHQIGVGLGCNGVIDVLFAPIDDVQPNNPLAVLKGVVTTRTPRLLLQVIGGATPDGQLYPVAELIALTERYGLDSETLEDKIATVRTARGSRVFELPAAAGVALKVLIEFLRPEMRLFVVGDNYDVTALAGLSEQLGWELHVIGTVRKVSKALFGRAHSVRAYARVGELVPDAYTAVLLMSHDFRRDLEMLRYFLPLRPRYLGLLGPKKRTVKLQAELDTELLRYAHTYSPTGLDIGAESPEEIGLAILAEIVSVFRRRDARPLRERRGPIHGTATERMPDTAVLLLAAGAARRMGEPKQLLAWGETTLLGHAIAQAKCLDAATVYVVTGAHRVAVEWEATRHGAVVVHNPAHTEGMGGSIVAGLEAIRRRQPQVERILVMLADQPLIPTAHYRNLLRTHRPADPTLVATRYDGARSGVPAVFGRPHFDALARLTGDRGARDWFRRTMAPIIGLPLAPHQLVDLDTPAAYAAAVERAGIQ